MADVFISYAREDKAFVHRLYEAFTREEREAWVDWEGIPPASEFPAEIQSGIEAANAFLFIISPYSIVSDWCQRELAHAVKHNKRLVPILYSEIADETTVPETIRTLHWISARADDEFETALQSLIKAIDTDLEWVRAHTRLTVRAVEWDRKGRSRSYVLRGEDLQEAEQWLAQGATKDPQPTALQTQYIIASRQDATRRQRTTLGAVIAFCIVVGVAAAVAFYLYRVAEGERQVARTEADNRATQEAIALTQQAIAETEAEARATQQAIAEAEAEARATQQAIAEERARVALSRQLAVQSSRYLDSQLDLALLLSVQANHFANTVAARGGLLDAIRSNPDLITFLHALTGDRGIAFSPDGQILAYNSGNNIILWNVTTGQPIGEPLSAHNEGITSLAFSPNGKVLASSSYDNTITLWDIASDQPISKTLFGHNDGILTIAFSPNGQTLASGGFDETIILWDVTSGQPIEPPLTGHTEWVYSVAFSPDGQTLASSSADQTIILWDVASRQPIGEPLQGHYESVESVAFSPDGQILASSSGSPFSIADYSSTIILWDVTSHQPLGQPLTSNAGRIRSITFSPDGRTLAASGNSISLWDVASNQMISKSFSGYDDFISSVAFSPNGRILASASPDKAVILWDMSSAQSLGKPLSGYNHEINSLAFSLDGKVLASGGKKNTIILWDVASARPIGQPLSGHADEVLSVTFSPTDQILASGSEDGTLFLWDLTNGQPSGKLLASNAGPIHSVTFSPDGQILASGGEDGDIRLWDVTSGQLIGEPLVGHDGAVSSLAFSPDGQTLASGSQDQTAWLWDVTTGDRIGEPLLGHNSWVWSVAFSPDGQILASGGEDGDIRLWDVTSGQLIGEPLVGHDGAVSSLAFSPDGQTLASASGSRLMDNSDRTVRLWDVATGQSIGVPFSEHSEAIFSVAFSPDGQTLASGGWDGTIWLWDVSLESWQARACHIANRDLTQSEWSRLVGLDVPYERTCSDLSVQQNSIFTVKENYINTAQRLTNAESLLENGENLAQAGLIEEAIAAYAEAQMIDPELEISNRSWNQLCWFGSLWGYAADAMEACEQAVELAPDDGTIRDSRGLARALTGDYAGAIEDFRFFVEWSKETGLYEQYRNEREAWIAELETGRNPFDETTLEELRNE